MLSPSEVQRLQRQGLPKMIKPRSVAGPVATQLRQLQAMSRSIDNDSGVKFCEDEKASTLSKLAACDLCKDLK